MNDLPDLLSTEQLVDLRALLPAFNTLTDEWMISSYTIAKMYVHENCLSLSHTIFENNNNRKNDRYMKSDNCTNYTII